MPAPLPDQDVIFFGSAAEFQARPNYVSELTCESTDLECIVGKYAFAKADALRCGLNRCRQPHQHGYVIRLRDRRETHCGQDCGAREFLVSWDEIEATFKRADAAKTRRDALAKIATARDPLLRDAYELRDQLKVAAERVSSIFAEMSADRPLHAALLHCLQDDGRIQVEKKVDEDIRRSMGEGAYRRQFQTLDTIVGIEAALSYANVGREFRTSVTMFLDALTDTALGQMQDRELEEMSRKMDDVKRNIAAAQLFRRSADRFFASANLEKFWLLRQVMTRRDVTSRTERILKRGTGTTPAVDTITG